MCQSYKAIKTLVFSAFSTKKEEASTSSFSVQPFISKSIAKSDTIYIECDIPKNFNERLVELRIEKGLSQKDAAADLGISQALLSHYEKVQDYVENLFENKNYQSQILTIGTGMMLSRKN